MLPLDLLRTENREGEKVRVAEFASPDEEAHWVASEIERLHEAGAPWRNFAVLYRKHTHRNQLLAALRRKRIPFVIRRFSILSSPLVRDLFAYLRLVAVPSDNIAAARVLAARYWKLAPRDLVRLAERAAKSRGSIWTEVEAVVNSDDAAAKQRRPSAWANNTRLSDLVTLIHQLRQSSRRMSTSDLLDDLIRKSRAGSATIRRGPPVPRTIRRISSTSGSAKRRDQPA